MKEERLKTLNGLRYGPMGPYDLATMVNVAPFTVRAELKAAKRERLVEEYIAPDRHVFELTARGREELERALQLAIPVADAPPRSPLSESCQRCGAGAGEPCRTDTGELATREHLARRRLAAYVPIGGVS